MEICVVFVAIAVSERRWRVRAESEVGWMLIQQVDALSVLVSLAPREDEFSGLAQALTDSCPDAGLVRVWLKYL
jgi:hypothetical protein